MNLRAQLTPTKKEMLPGTLCRMKDYPEQDWTYGKFAYINKDDKTFPYACYIHKKYKLKNLYSEKPVSYIICEEYDYLDIF